MLNLLLIFCNRSFCINSCIKKLDFNNFIIYTLSIKEYLLTVNNYAYVISNFNY